MINPGLHSLFYVKTVAFLKAETVMDIPWISICFIIQLIRYSEKQEYDQTR